MNDEILKKLIELKDDISKIVPDRKGINYGLKRRLYRQVDQLMVLVLNSTDQEGDILAEASHDILPEV